MFSSFEGGSTAKSTLVSAGLWTDISARVLRLPNLEELHVEKLGGGNFVPRKNCTNKSGGVDRITIIIAFYLTLLTA